MTEPGLRERKKAATRRSIQEHALRLFLSKGFDATTVAEIAAAADVSQMTFFRYFPTKEAAVESDDYDPLLAAAVIARPEGESGLRAIGEAVAMSLESLGKAELEMIMVRTRLILTTPALRARLRGNQEATQAMLAGALAARSGGRTPGFSEHVVAGAALSALDSALSRWVALEDAARLVRLVREAFQTLADDARRMV